jgi:hypothetical protein
VGGLPVAAAGALDVLDPVFAASVRALVTPVTMSTSLAFHRASMVARSARSKLRTDSAALDRPPRPGRLRRCLREPRQLTGNGPSDSEEPLFRPPNEALRHAEGTASA